MVSRGFQEIKSLNKIFLQKFSNLESYSSENREVVDKNGTNSKNSKNRAIYGVKGVLKNSENSEN